MRAAAHRAILRPDRVVALAAAVTLGCLAALPTSAQATILAGDPLVVPTNDLYANATVLPRTSSGTVSGTTQFAGAEEGEDASDGQAGRSVWFQFDAPASGEYAFDTLTTAGSPTAVPNTYLSGGTKKAQLSSFVAFSQNNDATGSTVLSRIVLPMSKDKSYLISVDGHDNGVNPTTGPFVLRWAPVDEAVPTTTITSPAANGVIAFGSSTLKATATVRDVSGVSFVQFAINDRDSITAERASGDTWTATLDVTGLPIGTHSLNVIATDSAFDVNQSTTTRTFVVGSKPAAPRLLKVVPGNAKLALSWLAPTGNFGATTTGYRATATPGGRTCVASTAARACVITGLTVGVRYTVAVAAINALGTGTSARVFGTPIPLGPPTRIKATPGATSGSATITFVAPPGGGINDYRLEYKVGAKWTVYKDGVSKATTMKVKLAKKRAYLARLIAVPGEGKATYGLPFTFRTR